MKPVHVILTAIAASLAGIIDLAGVLFVGSVGSGVTGRTGSSSLAMKARVCATTELEGRVIGFTAD